MAVSLHAGKNQFFAADGSFLASGKLYTYVPGTSTNKSAWTDVGATVAHANPIILDSRGEATIYWGGSYDVVLKTAADVTVWGPIRVDEPELAGTSSTDVAALRAELANVTTAGDGDSMIGWGAIVAIVDGVLTRYSTLPAAVTGIGSSRCTVIVRDDITMAANATFPSTARLWIENRARITTTGYTLTTNQTEPIAPPVQCFVGTGTLVMNRMAEVYPEWWGAVADDSTDCATAINAADAVACVGTLGIDGNSIVANTIVRFQPGNYRHASALTYRGAPWVGAGYTATIIRRTGSSGAAVDAVGTTGNRRVLSIKGIMFDGSLATGTAYGLRLGYNQRSFPALDSVRIHGFPGPGIYFASPTWSMSFVDVYLSFNAADDKFSGIYQDASLVAGDLVALEFHNLQVENNGVVGSTKSGGMQITGAQGLRFYGGVWEGNYGTSEAHFTDCEGVYVYGGHIESDVGSVDHGVLFMGASYGGVYGMTNTAETGFAGAGAAIYVGGTSIMTVDSVRSDGDWITNLAVADTAIVNLTGAGVMPVINTSGSGQLHRHTPLRKTLTDAATIATNATTGTEFAVTLGGNRTMGAPTNASIGQEITYLVIQDGTGGRTLAWNAVFKVSWSDTGNTAGKRSTISFSYDGTNWNQVGAQSPYI